MSVTENPVSEDNLAGKAPASGGGAGGDFWGIARTEQIADILNWKRSFGVSHWVSSNSIVRRAAAIFGKP